jgi:hypothetical protein
MRGIFTLSFLLGSCLSLARPAAASTLFAASFDQLSIYTLNQTSGAAALLGRATPMTDIRDLASDTRPGSFRIWGTSQGTGELFRINPVNGAATRVGNFGLPLNVQMRTLAFDTVSGTLYGTSDGAANLYEINPLTAASNLIGPIGLTQVGGTGCDAAGNLYTVVENTGGYYRIDKTTGSPTLLTTFPVTFISDLAFRPEDGALFGITHVGPVETYRSTYLLDPQTGGATRLGAYDPGISTMAGLAFGVAVPEPAAAALWTIFCVAALARRRTVRRRTAPGTATAR